MMPDEAQRRYEEAKRSKRQAERLAEDARSRRNQNRNTLSDKVREKNNLDERLSDLNKIVRLFEQNLEEQFRTDNAKARAAEASYRGAIGCTGGSGSASLADAFYTQSVNANADTASAYRICIQERDRVRNAIAELERTISWLNQEIDNLTREVRTYSNRAAQYQDNMNYYRQFFF